MLGFDLDLHHSIVGFRHRDVTTSFVLTPHSFEVYPVLVAAASQLPLRDPMNAANELPNSTTKDFYFGRNGEY